MTVDVVIVTYNRLEKLKKALASYDSQTKRFRNLIVVNNHSTDGTTEYLRVWEDKNTPYSKFVINTNENLGGSGGYYLGQKKALELGADWVFLADDDAYAATNMMESFYNYASTHDVSDIASICGTVFHMDGTIDMNHRSRYVLKGHRFFYRIPSTAEDYKKQAFEIDFLSYVGSFINTLAMKKVGLVDPRFFIYWDDTEHSLRLKKYGAIICVPAIRIIHDDQNTVQSEKTRNVLSWKDYYSERNEMVVYKRHFFWVALHRLRVLFFNQIKQRSETTLYDRVKWDATKDAWLGRLGKKHEYFPGSIITPEDK